MDFGLILVQVVIDGFGCLLGVLIMVVMLFSVLGGGLSGYPLGSLLQLLLVKRNEKIFTH